MHPPAWRTKSGIFIPRVLLSDCLFSGFGKANRISLVKQGVILFHFTIFVFTLPELLSGELDKAQLLWTYTYGCVHHNNFVQPINLKCGFHAITNAYLFNLVIVFSLDLWTHLKTNIIFKKINNYCQYPDLVAPHACTHNPFKVNDVTFTQPCII